MTSGFDAWRAEQRAKAIEGYLFARERTGTSGKLMRLSHEKNQFVQQYVTSDYQSKGDYYFLKQSLDDFAGNILFGIRIGATAGTAFIGGFMMGQIEQYGDVDQWRLEQLQPL